jgi:hypothetical protein
MDEKFTKENVYVLIDQKGTVKSYGNLIYHVPSGCRVERATVHKKYVQADYNPMVWNLVAEVLER